MAFDFLTLCYEKDARADLALRTPVGATGARNHPSLGRIGLFHRRAEPESRRAGGRCNEWHLNFTRTSIDLEAVAVCLDCDRRVDES